MDTESELEVARVITEDAGDVDNAPGDNHNQAEPLPASPTSSTASLKRPAGDMEDERDSQPESSNKRRKRESVSGGDESGDGTDAARLVRDMEVELSCPCCSALCYNPVIALPCQHYFCGSCYTMWTRYTGVTCPTCRQAVNQVIPSRAIQSIIEVYLRSVPSKARLPREMEQADEVYTVGSNIRVPTPRPRSPELAPPQDNDAYYRPCPHCSSPNDFNWVCPQPIIDPSVDISRASLLTGGPPPGHALCGSCEHLHATGAPSTSRCDFCRQTFCGLVSPQRCHARRVREAKPALLEGLSDLIVTPEAYQAFGVNAVEWEYLVDYLRDQGIGPKHIYVTIVENVLRGPEKWRLLLDQGMFPEAVAAAANDPQQRQRNVETDSASTSGSEAGAAGGSDEQQDDDNSRDAEMPEDLHPPPEINANLNSEASEAVPQPPTDADAASTTNPEPVITPQHDTEMPDAATARSAPAEPVIAEQLSSDAMVVASTQLDGVLATEGVTSPVETRAITPISVPTPQPEVDTVAILLDSAAAEFVPPVEVEPHSFSQVAVVATDNGQVPEGSPPTSDSASGTAVTSTSGSELVSSIPPSNSNEASIDSSPADAAPRDPSNPDISPNANTSGNTTNPTSRPRAVNLHLSKICRGCALEVFYWGAKQWWIKERANAHTEGTLPRAARERKDCPDMFQFVKKEGEQGDEELVVRICPQEDDHSHAREFNHIPRPPGWVPPPPRPPTPEQPPESAEISQEQHTNTSPDNDGATEGEGNQSPGAVMVDVVPQQPPAVSDVAAVSNNAAPSIQDPVLEQSAGETNPTVSDPVLTIPPIAGITLPGETPASGSGSSAPHVTASVDRMDVDIPSLPTPEDKSIVSLAAHTEPHTPDMAIASSAAGNQAPAVVQA